MRSWHHLRTATPSCIALEQRNGKLLEKGKPVPSEYSVDPEQNIGKFTRVTKDAHMMAMITHGVIYNSVSQRHLFKKELPSVG